MKRILLIALALLLAASSLFTSCKSCKKRDADKDQKQIPIDLVGEITDKIERAVYPIPSSAEIIKMLTELEVGYIIGVSNPVDNASNYITSKSQALNLGIYGADLSYATLYNMNQDVINYLDVIRELTNNLKMSKIYSKALYDDIKNSFDNRDRLVSILQEAFNETYSYLSDNNQQSLALLVVAGAWVEGMYITTHISESVYHVEGIVRVLLEQKESFELFLEIASQHDEDPVVSEILEILKPVEEVYKEVEEGSFTLRNVEDITAAVASVRDKLVS
ncbi:MAG TPA: hypothetical protein DEQ09_05110 [Bacteroidales bacterium]|nr:hypothetical protein [Bacteroidales bacterium]